MIRDDWQDIPTTFVHLTLSPPCIVISPFFSKHKAFRIISMSCSCVSYMVHPLVIVKNIPREYMLQHNFTLIDALLPPSHRKLTLLASTGPSFPNIWLASLGPQKMPLSLVSLVIHFFPSYIHTYCLGIIWPVMCIITYYFRVV